MREITQHDRENARRLKALWDARKKALGLTQVQAAKRLGFKNQGTVSQYLNAHIALHPKAIMDFAKLLQCEAQEIDPTVGGLYETPLPKRLTGAKMAVPVVGTLSGGEPMMKSVTVRNITMPTAGGLYALEVDNDLLGAFAKRGSVLVANNAEEPVDGDDVVIHLKGGNKLVLEYTGGDGDQLLGMDMRTGEEVTVPLADIDRVDPIIEVQRPEAKRPRRLRTAVAN